MRKNVREAPNLLTVAKTTFLNPKIMAPFFPFAQQHRKMNSRHGEVKKHHPLVRERELFPFLLRERAKTP